MARGGNAADAVCSAAFAAAAAEPALTGPGAGGFLLARSPAGTTTLLDFFVAVPGLGPGGRRLDPEELDSFTVPFGGAEQVFHIGPASVAVPGMVAGLAEAGERLGRLPLSDLVAPAAAIAREGAVIGRATAYLHEILHEMLTATPDAAAIFEPEGRPARPGERLPNPDLAAVLEQIGREGAGTARDGALASAIVEHLGRSGGLLTHEDLSRYEVVQREPIRIDFRGVSVITNAPPSTGGSLIGLVLERLATAPASAGAEHTRAVLAACEEANRRRDALSTSELRRADALAHLRRGAAGSPARRPTGTTHVSAVDADGGSASLSSSNGSGSGVVVPGTGVLLNNMLGEADINADGLGGLPPGERMSSMMAPTLLVRDGEPDVAIGSAGSNRLRSAIVQTIVSIVDGDLDLLDAVRRPRAHIEGNLVDAEPGVDEAALREFEGRGWNVRRWTDQNLFFGGVAAAGRDGGHLGAAGDPRRGGAAAGVTRRGEVVEL